MKGKKPLILIALVLALLAVALILPSGALGAPGGQPEGFASWGGTLANLVPPSPKNWPPEEIINIAWSVEARKLSETKTVGHLNMNVVENPEFPTGVYRTTDIKWSVFSAGDPSVALILFEWHFPWPMSVPVYNLVVLVDAARNQQDVVQILSYVGWEPTPGNWEGNETLEIIGIPAWGVQVVAK